MSATQALGVVALVAIGGAGGAVVRHLAVAAASLRGGGARAAAIAACNLVGAVLFAVVVGLEPSDRWWLTAAVGAGFCGALTTFSTWVADAVTNLQTGARPTAVIVLVDLGGQLVVGVGLAWLVLRMI